MSFASGNAGQAGKKLTRAALLGGPLASRYYYWRTREVPGAPTSELRTNRSSGTYRLTGTQGSLGSMVEMFERWGRGDSQGPSPKPPALVPSALRNTFTYTTLQALTSFTASS